jgi:hypothetical protein
MNILGVAVQRAGKNRKYKNLLFSDLKLYVFFY